MSNTHMKSLVSAAGGPMFPGENRKSWLARIARNTGLGFRAVQAAWWEVQMSAETERRLREAARSEANELAERFELLTRSMSVSDAEFFGPEIDALVSAARKLRNMGEADQG